MTLWGGAPSDLAWDFTTDTSDRRLLEVDIRGSIAHATMLGEAAVIDPVESSRLVEGLEEILDEARRGEFEFSPGDEDVHTAVERRLGEIVGSVAGKLHTGRSRNDQVALDIRLYLFESAQSRQKDLAGFISTVTVIAKRHAGTVVPSYTHLQQAQPTTLGNHLLAHAWMALRSIDRFEGLIRRLGASPLGAGASAGSSLAIDRARVAELVGFDGVVENTLDAVGSRDLVAEYVFVCAQSMTDLSRLAEEAVLWVSTEFGWAVPHDDVSTGSSALPQKRNPDIAELVRGRAAAVAGDLTAIIALQKALPLTYNRDLQEDKRIVFHADDTLTTCLGGMSAFLEGLEFEPPLPGSDATALDLAEALVARGVPFREAHHVVRALVMALHAGGRDLGSVSYEDLRLADARFIEEDVALVDPRRSVAARSHVSGPGAVDRQLRTIEADLRARGLG